MSIFTKEQILEAAREANREQRRTYYKAVLILKLRKIYQSVFPDNVSILKKIIIKLLKK